MCCNGIIAALLQRQPGQQLTLPSNTVAALPQVSSTTTAAMTATAGNTSATIELLPLLHSTAAAEASASIATGAGSAEADQVEKKHGVSEGESTSTTETASEPSSTTETASESSSTIESSLSLQLILSRLVNLRQARLLGLPQQPSPYQRPGHSRLWLLNLDLVQRPSLVSSRVCLSDRGSEPSSATNQVA